MIVSFRRHTLLPLDDCLYALQPSIPNLMRSSLHRCLQRHGISRLPDMEGDKPKQQEFKRYPIGYLVDDTLKVHHTTLDGAPPINAFKRPLDISSGPRPKPSFTPLRLINLFH